MSGVGNKLHPAILNRNLLYMNEHRWSGWPGAWCLDCGAEDQNEVCISGDCNTAIKCVDGHIQCDLHEPAKCLIHMNGSCPTPGAGTHNPYIKAR